MTKQTTIVVIGALRVNLQILHMFEALFCFIPYVSLVIGQLVPTFTKTTTQKTKWSRCTELFTGDCSLSFRNRTNSFNINHKTKGLLCFRHHLERCFILDAKVSLLLTVSYLKPFAFSVPIFCSEIVNSKI